MAKEKYTEKQRLLPKKDEEAGGGNKNEGGKAHPGTICDGCNLLTQGVHYKCTECTDYNLCGDCDIKQLHSIHKMITITPIESIWLQKIFSSERSNKIHDSSSINKIPTTPSVVAAGSNDNEIGSVKQKLKKEKFESIGIFGVFRFADGWDAFWVFLGMCGATVHGCTYALVAIIFAGIPDTIARYYLTHNNMDCDNQTTCFNQASTKRQICNEIDEQLMDDITSILWKMCTLAGSMWIAGYIVTFALNTAAERQVMRIRAEFLKAVLRQDITWHDMNTTTDFTSKIIEDFNKIEDGIGEKLGMLVSCVLAILLCFIVPFIQNWLISLVATSSAPLLAIVVGLMGAILTKISKNEMTVYSKANAISEEALASIRTVAAFGGEKREVEKYASELEAIKKNGIFRSTLTLSTMGLIIGIMFGVFGLGLWYGLKVIKDEEQTIDFKNCTATCNLEFYSDVIGISNCIEDTCRTFSIGSVTVALFGIVMGGMRIGLSITFLEAFNGARAAAYPIFQIIYRKSPIDSSGEEGKIPNHLDGKISFQNIFFNYPARRDVKILHGFSLDVESGKTVALVGQSGCGKSTCIQLIQRFYDPDYGTVLIDGQDIKTLKIGWVRDHIGVVSQEPVLFDCSIKDNIRYGKPNASDEEIERACKEANVYAFIQKLPQKYDTMVGEGGNRLSGGQKQRIAIARALIRDPKILLLDEATSALDTKNEAIVQAALSGVHKGRTTIVVAHRLSTIKNADIIAVIKEGKVAEKGTHEELMHRNGLYHNLVENQLAGEDPEEQHDVGELATNNESFKTETNIPRYTPYPLSGQISTSMDTKEDVRNVKIKTSRLKLICRLATLNSPELIYIIVGILAAMVFGSGYSAFGILLGDMISVFQEPNHDKAMHEARRYALGMVGVGIAFFLATTMQGCMFGISGEKLVVRVRRRMFESMLQQEIQWFDHAKNNTGALCTRLSDSAQAISGVTGSKIGQTVSGITTLFFGTVVAIYYNWKLGIVASTFLLPLCFGMMMSIRLMGTKMSSRTKALEKSSKTAAEAIHNIRTVAGLSCENMMVDQYEESLKESISKSIYSNQFRGLILGFAQANLYFAHAVCYYYGCHLITHSCPDEFDIMDVYKVSVASIQAGFMASHALHGLMDLSKTLAAAETIFELINRIPSINANPSAGLRLDAIHGNIDIVDGEFCYPTIKTEKVLRKLTLSVREGDKIAFVGESGCGKSTVIQLLQRFYDLDNGSLNIEKKNIKNLSVPFVRSKLGTVSQEPVLFNRSIADNIKYGDNTREVTMEEVVDAAKRSNIHKFVSKLPQGYDTKVGGKGAQLSGGQKQQIAIARALVRNPKILLLDEATSALDTDSEKAVQGALDSALEGRTSITVAHRLSTIVGSDKIFVIHRGQVLECGAHSELLEKKGTYYNLWNKHVS